MYKSGIALEEIDNYSICVLTKSGIRKMRFEEDIEADLVYVNNIPKIDDNESFTINKGDCVRYASVVVMPKMKI